MSVWSCDEPGPIDPEDLWLQHSDILRRLYITENKTLSQVKQAMESEYNFPTLRLHDYEIALRDRLRLRKNLTKQDWYAIGIEIFNRKSQGKDSEVRWNNRPMTAKKVRKEVRRNRKGNEFCSRRRAAELPVGMVVKTPPGSPSAELVVVVPPGALRLGSDQVISSPHHDDPNSFHADASTSGVQIAARETGQMNNSRFRHLREDIPFNQFMAMLLNLAKSQPLDITMPGEWARTPGPRLFGGNPSLEILARFTFQLSNKLFIDWTLDDHSWFLNWFGVSADFTMLRTFFSVRTPTVRAMYERLSTEISRHRRPAPARVLFEIQQALRNDNVIIGDQGYFLQTAVQIGSRAIGMLEVAERALNCIVSPPRETAPRRGHRHLQSMFMVAAAQRDMEMLGLLGDAFTDSDGKTELTYNIAPRLLALIMRQLYSWGPERAENDGTIADYIRLLIQGGILTTGIPLPCCCNDRLQVPIRNPKSLTVDELIMMCPPTRRKYLYSVVLRYSEEHRTLLTKAGIFTAASEGSPSLMAYLQSRNGNESFDVRAIMEECLLFAASLNDIKTASAMLDFGIDPDVGALTNNQERYYKGVLPWNPMIVAAAAGNLEVLNLLKERVNLASFVKMAPVYELVQLEDVRDKYGIPAGRELLRLENLQRHYLYSQTQIADAAIPDGIAYAGEFRFGEGFVDPDFFLVRRRRTETLAWLRNVAMAVGVKEILDKEIIEAAFADDPDPSAVKRRSTSYHPCDVLLLEGLLDAHLGYCDGHIDLLHTCIRKQCSLEVVELLLSKGLRVHCREAGLSGKTMLHDALLGQSRDRSEIVHLLLRQGADYTHRGEGLTVLEASLQGKDFESAGGPLDIFTYLFEIGASVQQRPRPQLQEWQPLICGLVDADAEDGLILQVLDAGTELNERGRNYGSRSGRMTPLEALITRGRENLARELIQRGADTHAPAGGDFSVTALQAACRARSSLHFIEYLVRVQNADVNEAPARKGGITALQWASFQGSLSVAQFLLDQGAVINALSGSGVVRNSLSGSGQLQAIDFATMGGRLDMVEFLLKAGGRSSTTGLRGAIHIARGNGHSAILSVLLHWERERGSRIIREEAEWQQQIPDPHHMTWFSLSPSNMMARGRIRHPTAKVLSKETSIICD